MAKISNFQAIAVIMVILIAAIAATYQGGDDDGGGGSRKSSGIPFDEDFGNVRVTMGDPPSDLATDSNTNEPHIAINPENPLHMVAGGNDYSTVRGDVWVGYYWTFDGGKSWNRSFIPGWDGDFSPDGIQSDLNIYRLTGGTGDPVVAFGPGGEVYMAGIAFWRSMAGPNSIWVARSDDGGVTFPGDQIYGDITIGDGLAAFHDKEWIAVDMNNGNVYVTWSLFSGLSRAQIAFTRSTNGGQSWTPPLPLSETLNMELGNQGSQVVVGSDGRIHVTWIDFDRGVLRYTWSDNEGDSWGGPMDVCDVDPMDYESNNGTYRTPSLPSMKVDTSGSGTDGRVYVTWSDDSEGDPNVYMVISPDNGDTWEDPFRVNGEDSGNDQFFPTLAISPNGEVVVTYYDKREDPYNTMLDMYMSASTDGGQSFVDFKITTEPFNGNAGGGSPLGQATNGSAFIGDYIGSVASDEHVLTIWCDTRNGGTDAADRNSDLYVGRMILDRLYD
jgi:hypothetical protein